MDKLSKIKRNKLEINKPSELCQVVCMDENKNLTGELTATQMDLMNLLLYKSRELIVKNQIEKVDEFFNIEIELHYFNSILGKNTNSDYKRIVEHLTNLKRQLFVINALGKNKDIETTVTSFVHKITFSRHKDNYKKLARIILDGEIINLVINTKKYFSKMFLKIQFDMVSKYSKALYELLKDYEGIRTITIDLQLIFGLLNVDISKKTNIKWSTFRPNILEKAVNEINEKSDIKVSYEPIKEKIPGQRKQVTKIKFNINKQPESRLQELGLIEEPITSLPFYNKSKSKLDKLVKNGYNVIDEDMWIETDIKKNEDRYDAEVRIDKWLKETYQEVRNDIYKILAESLDDCEDPMAVIEDYRIVGLFTKEVFTKTPKETIDLLNEVILTLNEIDE